MIQENLAMVYSIKINLINQFLIDYSQEPCNSMNVKAIYKK